MADGTAIEWTDATWNPVTGCSIVSPGCTNCYAMQLAGTRLKHTESRKGLTVETKAGPVWNGQVRFNREWLDQPLRWRRPRRIFVCAHGDLFAEGVPDEWIDQVFAVMALTPQHTFQVLTKRPARMRAYLSAARAHPVGLEALGITLEHHVSNPRSKVGAGIILQGDIAHLKAWPLPNVWLGVSCEDQRRADERIPDLLATPAAIRFVSAEPLLGPIDFTKLDLLTALGIKPDPEGYMPRNHFDALRGISDIHPIHGAEPNWGKLDWIIVGGESGPRPMHPNWARSILDQCAAAGTAFFFKQWGSWAPDGWVHADTPFDDQHATFNGQHVRVASRADLTPTNNFTMKRVGKKAAGRLLDGALHSAMPAER